VSLALYKKKKSWTGVSNLQGTRIITFGAPIRFPLCFVGTSVLNAHDCPAPPVKNQQLVINHPARQIKGNMRSTGNGPFLGLANILRDQRPISRIPPAKRNTRGHCRHHQRTPTQFFVRSSALPRWPGPAAKSLAHSNATLRPTICQCPRRRLRFQQSR